jgi:hypothetical protein
VSATSPRGQEPTRLNNNTAFKVPQCDEAFEVSVGVVRLSAEGVPVKLSDPELIDRIAKIVGEGRRNRQKRSQA